jgi:hypothetical protein
MSWFGGERCCVVDGRRVNSEYYLVEAGRPVGRMADHSILNTT